MAQTLIVTLVLKGDNMPKSITYVTIESKSLCPVEFVTADLLFSVFCYAAVIGVMVLVATWVSAWATNLSREGAE